MSALAALICDVDGTLADTERDGHRVAFNRAFAAAGLAWDWTEALYGRLLEVTGGKERIRHYPDRCRPDGAPRMEAADIARLHAAKTCIYNAMLEEGVIPLRSGVRRLLREARAAGLRLAIATTTTARNVTTLLEHTLGPEALGWFEVISADDVVPAKKPAPDVFLHALDGLGVAPDACIAFEDSAHGLAAARAAVAS